MTVAAVLTMAASAPAASAAAQPGPAGRLELRDGWAVQSSRKVKAAGEVVSTKGFATAGWYQAAVPATVLAAQVAAGAYKDLYRGMNLRKLPGMTYPIGLNSFSNVPMRKDSPYAVAWWYRTEVSLPAAFAGKRVWLHLGGVNYRANLWINGHKVASDKDLQGAYRIYDLDVTDHLYPGETNVLALDVSAPTEKQLGINWVDWNPTPPDKNMGLWGAAYLTTSGPVSVRHPQVVTHFASAALAEARLTVMAELQNSTDAPVAGVARISIDGGAALEQPLTLAAHESRRVTFAPDRFAALVVQAPKIWWPAEMGQPALHDLAATFAVGGAAVSDQRAIRFGIREVTSEMTPDGFRLFRINGRRILIRGGGWMQDMLLRPDSQRLQAQLSYVQDMHLNTLRLEAQFETDEFFDLADQKGLLIMAGWCCCDIWEKWKDWPRGTLEVATAQLRSQALRLRRHPSMISWMNGSDGPPPADVEAAYAKTLADAAWPNVVLNSAADADSKVTGRTGLKMSGPYDYEPPSYWFSDQRKLLTKKGMISTRFGGAFGFNTETGPGPAIPALESLKKMLPPEHLWPMDNVWGYHAAGERFQTMGQFHAAMKATYGAPTDLNDFLRKAQAMAYDGQRAMYEAYSRNKYTSTGVIQWLINSAWPSTFWHLYDYYLYPTGGYFGTKLACQPLHVLFSPDDRGVFVVNSRQEAARGLAVTARAFDFALREIFASKVMVDSAADSSARVATIPAFPPGKGVYFVKLTVADGAENPLASNFYWLPAAPSTIAWNKVKDTAIAPIRTFEDLTLLNKLAPAKLTVSASRADHDGAAEVAVTVSNPTAGLAFQVHLGVRQGQDEEVLPVLWQDNYLSLLPGESRTVIARYLPGTKLDAAATVLVDGWNIPATTVAISDVAASQAIK
ncbi:MAG TPA: glycosyl hydrolase family 2 [Polyangia bacterium]|nr:glycosyl hydrolase family 2 [Polyangia bacterium]